MVRHNLYTAALAAALTLTLTPTSAPAQKAASGSKATKPPAGDVAEARALFDKGIALSDEGKWADALEAFRESDALVPSARVRFNMAVSLRALGRYVEAKRLLPRLLEEQDGLKLKPDLRAEARKLLGEVEAKVVRVHLTISPAAAALEIDGEPAQLDATGGVELDPGKHVFVVSAEGHDTTTVSRTLSSGQTELALSAPLKKVKVIEKRVEVPVQTAPVYKRAWFWVGLSTVAAGGAAVGVFFAVRPDKKAPVPPTSTTEVVIAASFDF